MFFDDKIIVVKDVKHSSLAKEVLKIECSENFFDNIASLLLLKKSFTFTFALGLGPIFYIYILVFNRPLPPPPVVVRFF